jgi:hypothetical protein
MSRYLLADTNYLLPESSYLPRHTSSTAVSMSCRNGVAENVDDRTLNFGRLATAESPGYNLSEKSAAGGLCPPAQVRLQSYHPRQNPLMIAAKTRGLSWTG